MPRRFVAVGLAAFLLVAVGSFHASAQPTPPQTCPDPAGCVVLGPGEPITIGTLVVTHLIGDLGVESARAVELAVGLGGGSVAGHPVQLLHLADGCDPHGGEETGLATSSAEAVTGDAALVAVIGTTCSDTALQVAPILGGAGVTMVSPSNTSSLLTDPSIRNPFYFRTVYNEGRIAAALAPFLIGEGHATAAIVVVDDSGPAATAQHFADQFTGLGGEVTDQLTVSDGQDAFSSELAQIAGNPPDVLFFYMFSNVAAFISQARDVAALDNTVLVSISDIVNEQLLDQLDEPADAEGIVVSAPDQSFLAEAPYLDMLEAYVAAFGDGPTFPFHAHAYAFDATNRLLDIIPPFQQGGSPQLVIPRTALRDAFAATAGYPGVVGSITCDPNGDCHDPAQFVILVFEDGSFVEA